MFVNTVMCTEGQSEMVDNPIDLIVWLTLQICTCVMYLCDVCVFGTDKVGFMTLYNR